MTTSRELIRPIHVPPEKRTALYPVRQLVRNFLGTWPLVGLMFVGAVISVLTVPFSPDGWGARTAYWCYRMWALALLKGFGVRVWVKHGDIAERTPPCVIAMNHRSHFDIPSMSFMKRAMVAVHKRSLEYIPLLGQVIWLSGSVGIDRNDAQGTRRRMAIVKRRLAGGRSVAIFPEGRRSRGPALGPFKKGAAVVAIEQQCPILPVTILGTDVIYPPGSIMVHRGDVLVILHEPVPTTGLTVDDRETLTQQIRATIEKDFLAGPVDLAMLEGATRVV